jgi:hypothetical protein
VKLFGGRLVGRRAVVPLAAMVATALLAACSSSGNGSSASGSGAAAVAAASGDNGVIDWAYTSDQPNWDPVVVGATSATQLLSTVYEPLFTLTPDGSIAPALAQSYKSFGTSPGNSPRSRRGRRGGTPTIRVPGAAPQRRGRPLWQHALRPDRRTPWRCW